MSTNCTKFYLKDGGERMILKNGGERMMLKWYEIIVESVHGGEPNFTTDYNTVGSAIYIDIA